MKKWQIHPQRGDSFEIEAETHGDAAGMVGDMRRKECLQDEVIGITGPKGGQARFYSRQGAVMYPISAATAGTLTHING